MAPVDQGGEHRSYVVRHAPCWALVTRGALGVGIAFGPLGSDDARRFSDDLEIEQGRGVTALVADFTAVGSDGLRFALGLTAMEKLPLAKPLELLALAHPDGPAGALLLGLGEVLARRMPARLHPRRGAMLDALAPEVAAVARAAFDELDAFAAERTWVADVRRLLIDEPELDAKGLAARFEWSERTLQRRLDQVDSSFRAERARARMENAIELLAFGNDKVGAIARMCGFESESQFGRAFREYTGMTPVSLREAAVTLTSRWTEGA